MAGRDHTDRGDRAACYWKNNQQIWLSGDKYSYANDIAVSGNDIFVVGSVGNSNQIYKAVYWLNGQEYLLDESGRANDIFIEE